MALRDVLYLFGQNIDTHSLDECKYKGEPNVAHGSYELHELGALLCTKICLRFDMDFSHIF
jgi:hypothetical protein